MRDETLWVFGYGSLIWDPGFAHEGAVPARLSGFRRSFCMRSIHHRGTPERPGLVLALEPMPGAACEGIAYSVPAARQESVLDYLRERELVSSAYVEARLPLLLAGGQEVEAVAFIMDKDHVQYCGGLPLEEQAAIIASAAGGRGANADYLWNTAAHLRDLGLADPELEWLAEQVRGLARITTS